MAPHRDHARDVPAAGLTLRLLGPVAGALDDDEVDLGSPRQQAVLVMLATRAGRVVTMSQLIEGLWGEAPPASAEQSVYTYVAGLRRVLEPGRGRREPSTLLIGAAGGYRLQVDPGQVDSRVFAERLDAAGEAGRVGDHVAALRHLHQALALWRGPALSGVPGPFAERERARLEELRLTAAEDRADALIRLGRPQEALTGLQDLSRHHPFRERPRELLMLALYGCGRQAEALAVFEETRRLLSEELGVDPGDGLRRAHQLVLSGTGGDAVPAPPVPRQLPRDLIGFVGRADESARLKALLVPEGDGPPHPFVVISGPPGVGKSALAVHVAHMVKERFPGGQLYVNLRGGTPNVARLSSHDILSRLLRGIGTPDDAIPAEADEAAALWRSRLHDKRLLILLDDAADLTQVRPFLSAPFGTALLVTSRESLIAGDDCVQLQLGPLPDAEATAMLAGLAGAGRVSADLPEATRLVRLCDGLPLALRIAGARLASRPDWSVGALVRRLSDERGRLHELEAGELAVRSSLAASWNALNGSARPADRLAARMLALLGLLHVPDVTTEAASSLFDSSVPEAERALERLSDAHLLERGVPGRYHLHDLVRLFAGELTPAGERIAPLTRVLSYYVASARAAVEISDPHRVHSFRLRVEVPGRRFESPDAAYDWLTRNEPTLLAAASQAMADPDEVVARLGTEIVFAMMWYQQKAYRVADLISLGAQVMSVGDRLDDDGIRMHAHAHIGVGRYFKGSLAQAVHHAEQHLTLARRLGDRFNVQRAHGNLAATYAKWNQFDDVLRNALAQREIAREISSGVGERFALLMLGSAYEGLGRLTEAAAALAEAAAMARSAGDAMQEAHVCIKLGRVLLDLGELDRARALLEGALALAHDSKTKTAEVGCLVLLVRAHRLLGRLGEARERLSQAVSLASGMGSAYWLEQALHEQEALDMGIRSAPA
ncbi:BTAD domain-containing putative transcriptional regulator [Nonomuraea sp. NPDC000554]|uniref:AfsR/SARP family transcriptional regulator n=1 Tax=Nonomuraea sp. NPDC000554 TaxID=3154259 RepID=UPI00332B694B